MNRAKYADNLIIIGLSKINVIPDMNLRATYYEAAAELINDKNRKRLVSDTASLLRNAERNQITVHSISKDIN